MTNLRRQEILSLVSALRAQDEPLEPHAPALGVLCPTREGIESFLLMLPSGARFLAIVPDHRTAMDGWRAVTRLIDAGAVGGGEVKAALLGIAVVHHHYRESGGGFYNE
jgi:hypothetical protein